MTGDKGFNTDWIPNLKFKYWKESTTHVIAAQKLTCCDALMRICHLWRATNFFKTLFFIGSTLKTKTHLFFWCSKFQFSIWRLEWIVIWFKGLRNQRGGKKCNFRKADMALEVAKNSQLQNLFIKCLWLHPSGYPGG